MAVAHGSQTRLAYVMEATPGVIPATPSWQVARYVSEGLILDKQTISSDEVRADRNRTDATDVGRQVTGPINTLLSYGTFDDWLSALFAADWASDELKNGNAIKTLAFEKTFELGATDVFTRYRGCRVNTLDLQLNAKQNVTANWGIMGLGSPAPANAIVTGATYAAATTTPVLNAALNVGVLSITGVTATPKLQALSIRINNGLYPVDVIGQYETYDFGLGLFDVSGSMTVLFENKDMYEAIVNHTDLSLSTTIGAATNEKYTISVPKLKALNGSPVGPGNGRAVVMEVPFQGLFDATLGATVGITRAVA
ncbi:phage tail tube protein [Pararhizobium sp. BT-229]|uniref:phage tail tube protein n=1 Tax=Pararhizobium sp. BT-229 TaxID=2986923 RepID=UPI0021F6B236|nr:phage tail tube protein [Pararhizobium sp. BT-229]MCV9960731.1 phage tail tube protein [Pararhizobium sp. BT-229]